MICPRRLLSGAIRWWELGVVLCALFVAACATAPRLPAATSPASSPPSAIITYHGHTCTVFAVAWSPDGTRIASGGNDETVQVWDVRTGRVLVTYTGHSGTVCSVAWSPDGTRIASGSDDATVQVWDATSGREALAYRGQTAPLWAVAWVPGGTCLASAADNLSDGQQAETVQVWRPATGQLLGNYTVPSNGGYADGTLTVAWSPDGKHIASGGADTVVHLWNAPFRAP